ncbi:MAG: SCO family protein [Candidatus Hydrogenedentes bacterium]|jgi:protein SCO1/2|nr:SCO family protein [Candidatus Hydrogenedentota bacterium]
MAVRKSALVGSVLVLAGILMLTALTLERFLKSASRPIADEAALPDLGKAPEFSLTDSGGVAFDSKRLDGQIYVIDFIFTNCSGICPILSNHMAGLHRAYSGRGGVEFVSITVDPERDTPEVLTEYAERFGADTGRWHFLTGALPYIHDVAVTGFKVGSMDDPLIHSERLILVGREGVIRGYYDGTEADSVLELSRDIAILAAQ